MPNKYHSQKHNRVLVLVRPFVIDILLFNVLSQKLTRIKNCARY